MTTSTSCLSRKLLLLSLLSISLVSYSQQDQDAGMKAWMAYMTPGEMHSMLAKSNGEWATEMTMWMDPKAQPVKSTGTCNNTMIMGNRYQQSSFKGDFMGQPMEGMSTVAYDNAKKQFESVWVDNMGSGMMKASGTYDAATKTLNMKGVSFDPMSGKDMTFRETHKFIDDDNQLMEMFVTPAGGQEFKTMEIKFTRKK